MKQEDIRPPNKNTQWKKGYDLKSYILPFLYSRDFAESLQFASKCVVQSFWDGGNDMAAPAQDWQLQRLKKLVALIYPSNNAADATLSGYLQAYSESHHKDKQQSSYYVNGWRSFQWIRVPEKLPFYMDVKKKVRRWIEPDEVYYMAYRLSRLLVEHQGFKSITKRKYFLSKGFLDEYEKQMHGRKLYSQKYAAIIQYLDSRNIINRFHTEQVRDVHEGYDVFCLGTGHPDYQIASMMDDAAIEQIISKYGVNRAIIEAKYKTGCQTS